MLHWLVLRALQIATNNTPELIKQVLCWLRQIFLKGFRYQKVEIMALGLIPEEEV